MYRSPAATSQPAGTFLPGTKVQVGNQRVVIEKYLSEGGFAHVYVVRVPRDNNKHELAVLKRVAVPDRDHLASMRTEVETMKKLKGHKEVVTYMDSHASQLKGGGYEVFLLMEYCAGGGLIDFMNTRLQHRLTEPEILKIFGDVAEGVACMHYLKPPLLHRDLKVENVLISKSSAGGTPTYKLCDFGSAASPRPAAKTTEEGRLIEEDVQKHTTMQYRSPEMIDVWRKQPIDEKADIWALGVLLYKLCYYTTPFEDVGQMAILNASYKYPSYPSFSERLKRLIAWCLKEDPKRRPNIYEVIKEECSMRGTTVPIKDIYANRTRSESRRNEFMPEPAPPMSSAPIGLRKEVPVVQMQALPDITPMRRGRPTAPTQQAPDAAARPSPSPARGDPFAALDSKNFEVRAGAVDELSKKFPSLDEFSIAHDKSGNFSFSQSGPNVRPNEAAPSGIDPRKVNALADEVFAQSTSQPKADVPRSQSTAQLDQPATKASPAKPSKMSSSKMKEFSQQSPLMHQPKPMKPGVSGYTSTGVGSSPPPTKPSKMPEISNRAIWRVPTDHHRSASQPRASDVAQAAASLLQPSLPPSRRPALLDIHRSKSQTATLQQAAITSPTSSRPSLEGHRPSHLELDDSGLSRAKSAQSRPRPSSVYVSSNLDYLRDQESARKRPSMEKRPSMDGRRHSRQASRGREAAVEDAPIDSDMDYLRNNEESNGVRRKSSRKESSGHKKRSSLPSISGAKNIFSGRFGDAFKRFERDQPTDDQQDEAAVSGQATPHPRENDEEPRMLSPIPASEATGTSSKHSDGGESAIDETEDLPPDVRRELERRRLSQEEKRVAEAAAEYRARVGVQGTGGSGHGPSRASTIQKRVQSLLDEGRQSPGPTRRTAEGYGKYTAQQQQGPPPDSAPAPHPAMKSDVPSAKAMPPPLARKPMQITSDTSGPSGSLPYQKTRQNQASTDPPPASVPHPPASAPPTQQPSAAPPQARIVSRPSVPPKSQALRTGPSGRWPPQQQAQHQQSEASPSKATGGLAALLAKDLEGVPEYPASGNSVRENVSGRTGSVGQNGTAASYSQTGSHPVADDNAGDLLDLEADFSKRYPSLSGIEMVETEIGGGQGRRTMREKEV